MIKMRRPAKSGVYQVKCPHCGITKKLKLKGVDAIGDAPAHNAEAKPQAPDQNGNQPPAAPDNSAKAPIRLNEDFLVGEMYKVKCPHCNRQEMGLKNPKAGRINFACPYCHGKLVAEFRSPTVPIAPAPLANGKLVLLKKGWLNKTYPLPVGKHTIGRYDNNEKSEIMVANDSSMSRRSVEIDVSNTGNGLRFKMTVLKATNPVLHNNQALTAGEAVSLNFGDSIILGKTKFRFEMDK